MCLFFLVCWIVLAQFGDLHTMDHQPPRASSFPPVPIVVQRMAGSRLSSGSRLRWNRSVKPWRTHVSRYKVHVKTPAMGWFLSLTIFTAPSIYTPSRVLPYATKPYKFVGSQSDHWVFLWNQTYLRFVRKTSGLVLLNCAKPVLNPCLTRTYWLENLGFLQKP